MKRYAQIFLLFGLFVAYSSFLHARRPIFPTLTAVSEYASSLPEQVETDTDWLHPDFSSFHKERRPGVIRRFFSWFGVGRPAWNPQGFNVLLGSLTKKRELDGMIGDFIQKYEESPGDRFFIWTDLFGAFHSLVRDLVELRGKGIIADDFKIMQPTNFFVFNGNVIDHSPYVLETLTLVMRLLEANPKQLFYIRGYHEDKQEWQSYALAHELKIRASGFSREVIPLSKRVTRFFNTLPLGLFLPVVTENSIDTVLIANNEYSKAGFEAKDFAGFLEHEGSGTPTNFKIDNKMSSLKKVQIKVLISGEDRSVTYHQTTGLTLIGMQRESLRWLNFSSPTGRNRRLYDFFYDAFVELKVAKNLSDWTLTLYNQDVRKLLGFKAEETYNLLTGQPVGQKIRQVQAVKEKKDETKEGKEVASPEKMPQKPTQDMLPKKDIEDQKEPLIDKQKLVVGATIDLSKGASYIGKLIQQGLDLAFAQVAEQGVGSYLPRITIYDDEYTPRKTMSLLSELLGLGVDILLDPVGSATTESYLNLIKEGKVLVLFPYTGATILRKPDLKFIAHMRVGYADEGRALASYALDELGTSKVAVFYQNDSFGRSALEGVMEVFDKRGFKNVLKLPYNRNETAFNRQVEELKKQEPDTIFFFSVVPAAKSLITQMGTGFFSGKKLIGMSVYNELFEKFLAERGLRFIMVRVVPDPNNDDLEIVREYREATQKANQSLNATSLEAFINAHVFFDLLKKIKPPLTKEKIIQEIEGIKQYNFKGIELDFYPSTRELVNTLWIDTGKKPWIKKEVRRVMEEKQGALQKIQVPEQAEQKKEVPKKEAEKEKKAPEPIAQEPNAQQPLTLGSLFDLSKGIKQQGRSLKEGIELRLKEGKKAGETQISQIIIVDDEYTPRKTLQEVEHFIEKGITIFLAPAGSPTLAAYLDKVKEGKVLVLFPITGAPIFRQKELKYMVHIRPSYKTEGKILAEYAIDKLKAQKAVMFYQDDAFGKGLLEGAEEMLKQKGITHWKAVSYMRNDLNFTQQVATIKTYEPDAILLFCTTAAATGLIRDIGIQNMSAKYVLGNSDFGEEKFLKFATEKGIKLLYLNVVPNPNRSDIPIINQFRDAATQYGVEINTFSLEAYIAADFFVDMLKKMSGPITKEKIIDALENIKNVNYKGLEFNFNPENRTLSSTFWLSTDAPEWEKIEVKN